jgi:hypothetical protein
MRILNGWFLFFPYAGFPVSRVSVHGKRVLFVHDELAPDAVFWTDGLALPHVLLLEGYCHTM